MADLWQDQSPFGGSWGDVLGIPRPAASAPAAPAPAPTGGGGGGYYDPYAAQRAAAAAEAQRQAQVKAQAQQAWQGVVSGGDIAANDVGNVYADKVRPFLVDLETGVGNINKSRSQNSLNLRRTGSTVAGNVRQGLRSGGVNLANLNATDSGATRALGQAWARVGNQQMGSARNDAALKSGDIDVDASTLDKKKADTMSSFEQYRTAELNRLNQDLTNKLQAIVLDLQAQNTPNFINVAGDRDSIIGRLRDRFAGTDKMAGDRIAAAKYLTPEEVEARAYQMDVEGAAASPFDVVAPNVVAPQGTPFGGPPLSQIPFMVRRREQATEPRLPAFSQTFPDQSEVPVVPLALGG